MPMVNSCLPMLPVHRESQVHSKFVGTCSLSVVAPMSAGCYSCVNVNSIWKCSHRANLWEGPHSKSFKHPSCLFHSSRNQYGRADRGKFRILTLRSVLFMHCPSILKKYIFLNGTYCILPPIHLLHLLWIGRSTSFYCTWLICTGPWKEETLDSMCWICCSHKPEKKLIKKDLR
jgi:hypothetical protein